MPSPFVFLWAGIGLVVIGKQSMTLLNLWFKACIFFRTSVIWEFTLVLIVSDIVLIWLVISLQILLISLLNILVKSFFMSSIICAHRDWAVKGCDSVGCTNYLVVVCLEVPFWFRFRVVLVSSGYSALSNVRVFWVGYRAFGRGDLFHLVGWSSPLGLTGYWFRRRLA